MAKNKADEAADENLPDDRPRAVNPNPEPPPVLFARARRIPATFDPAWIDTIDRAVALKLAMFGYTGPAHPLAKGEAVHAIVSDWLKDQSAKLASQSGE